MADETPTPNPVILMDLAAELFQKRLQISDIFNRNVFIANERRGNYSPELLFLLFLLPGCV